LPVVRSARTENLPKEGKGITSFWTLLYEPGINVRLKTYLFDFQDRWIFYRQEIKS